MKNIIKKIDEIFGTQVVDKEYQGLLKTHKKRLSKEDIDEKAPEGWEGTVRAMKKDKDIDNPFALAHAMKKKGAKPHYSSQKPYKKKSEYKEK